MKISEIVDAFGFESLGKSGSFHSPLPPVYSAASGTSVITIIFSEATIAFTINGGAAFAASEYIFDSHEALGLIVLDSFFCACGNALDVVAINLVHNFGVIFPLPSVLHAALAGVKNLMDDSFFAGLLRDSVISKQLLSNLNLKSLIRVLLTKSPSGFCSVIYSP